MHKPRMKSSRFYIILYFINWGFKNEFILFRSSIINEQGVKLGDKMFTKHFLICAENQGAIANKFL